MKTVKKFSEHCVSVNRRPRNIIVNILPVLCVVLIIWIIPSFLQNKIRCAFAYIQAPARVISQQFECFKKNFFLAKLSKKDLITFCEHLKRENLFLHAKVTNLERNLGEKLDNHEFVIEDFLAKPAKVLKRDLASWSNEITIDIGKQNGISTGMGVVSKNHVVGRIKSVNFKTSVVELATSPQFRMVVNIKDDNDRSPIIFSGNQKSFFAGAFGKAVGCPKELLRENKNIILITSHFSEIFPKNFEIGTICVKNSLSEEYNSYDVSLDNEIFSKLYEVSVLIKQKD